MNRKEIPTQKIKEIFIETIDALYDDLPENLQEDVVFNYVDDELIKKGDQVIRADDWQDMEPDVITFYLEALMMVFVHDVKELVNHEMAHSFGIKDEEMANRFQDSAEIFKLTPDFVSSRDIEDYKFVSKSSQLEKAPEN